MALLDDAPRSTEASADGPVRLIVLANRDFRALLDEAAPIRATVLETQARRIRSYESGV